MILSQLQVASKIKHQAGNSTSWMFFLHEHTSKKSLPWWHQRVSQRKRGHMLVSTYLSQRLIVPSIRKIDKMSLILLVAQLFTATYSCLFWFVKLIYQGFQSVRINHWFPGPCRSGCHGQTQRHLRAFGPDMSSSSSRILQCKEMTIQPESDRLNYSWRSEIWKSDSFLACESDIACHSEKKWIFNDKGRPNRTDTCHYHNNHGRNDHCGPYFLGGEGIPTCLARIFFIFNREFRGEKKKQIKLLLDMASSLWYQYSVVQPLVQPVPSRSFVRSPHGSDSSQGNVRKHHQESNKIQYPLGVTE